MRSRLAYAVVLLFTLCAAGPASAAESLLAGQSPVSTRGVEDAERLTDGIVVPPGDHWRTNRTVELPRSAEVIYRLPEGAAARFLYLQGDNNDDYRVEVSEGEGWRTIWLAGSIAESGMRARWAEIPAESGPLLRLRSGRGDAGRSVSELAVFSERPDPWPPAFEEKAGRKPIPKGVLRITAAGAAVLLFVLLYRGTGWRQYTVVLPAGALVGLAAWTWQDWPLAWNHVALLKAVIAVLAVATLIRASVGRDEDRRWTLAVLGALAALAVASYYELGNLPFRHEAERRPTLVHTNDMRHYFPLAKYFEELRFDGLYFASVAAYLDDVPQTSVDDLARVRIRDLRNNKVSTADKMLGPIDEARARFSPARWEEFRTDMRWFREAMGGGYLRTITDHGGNSTPAWIVGAHLLYRWLPANEWVLSLTGLIDPLLLALMFLAIARTFGVRPMLVCVILWGVSDFGRFGATLVGSTLRYDWIACLGFGVCALRTQRWVLGGALLAYAGMIRAFPALALFFLLVPLAWAIRRLDWKAELRPLLRVATGAGLAVAILVGSSVAMFGWEESWGAWFAKIVPHADKPNVNHVGLRTVIAYEPENVARRVIDRSNPEPWTRWQETQLAAWERRQPVYLAAAALLLGVLVWAARNRRLDQAALLGMLAVPIFFYPANYYYHYVALLPLVALGGERDGPRFVAVSCVLLAVSAAQYPTLMVPWSDECFTWQTWLLLGAVVAIPAALLVPGLSQETETALAT